MPAGQHTVARREKFGDGSASALDIVHARHKVAAPDRFAEIDHELDKAAAQRRDVAPVSSTVGPLPRFTTAIGIMIAPQAEASRL